MNIATITITETESGLKVEMVASPVTAENQAARVAFGLIEYLSTLHDTPGEAVAQVKNAAGETVAEHKFSLGSGS